MRAAPEPSRHEVVAPRSTRDGEEVPGAGNAFQLVVAAVFELDARTGDEVNDCSGREHFTRGGQAGDPRCDVNTDTGDILVDVWVVVVRVAGVR